MVVLYPDEARLLLGSQYHQLMFGVLANWRTDTKTNVSSCVRIDVFYNYKMKHRERYQQKQPYIYIYIYEGEKWRVCVCMYEEYES